MRHVSVRRVLRGRRTAESLRSGHLCSQGLRRSGCRVRARVRRLRRGHRVRYVRWRRDLRRGRGCEPMRLSRQDLRPARCHMRQRRRRLWRHAELRYLRAAEHVWRRRHAQPVWLPAEDVLEPQRQLRLGARWMWCDARLWNVRVPSNLRRRGNAEPLRRRALHAARLYAGRSPMRNDFRQLRWDHRLRHVHLAPILWRGWRHEPMRLYATDLCRRRWSMRHDFQPLRRNDHVRLWQQGCLLTGRLHSESQHVRGSRMQLALLQRALPIRARCTSSRSSGARATPSSTT
jgi:hypothetical protein